MTKMKQSDRLTRILEGAISAGTRAAELAERLEPEVKEAGGALLACVREVGTETTAAKEAACAAAWNIAAAAEKTRSEIHTDVTDRLDRAAASALALVDAEVKQMRLELRATEKALAKAAQAATDEVTAAVGKLDAAFARMEAPIQTVTSLLARLDSAVQACKAAKGSMDEARSRLAAATHRDTPLPAVAPAPVTATATDTATPTVTAPATNVDAG